jgi:hypothetical protein
MRSEQRREQIARAIWLDRKPGRCDAAEEAVVANNRFDMPRGRIVKGAAGDYDALRPPGIYCGGAESFSAPGAGVRQKLELKLIWRGD